MSNNNPGGQRAVSRIEFNKLGPRQQGYVSYMQGQWNPSVPNARIYAHGTDARSEWKCGEQLAVLEVQDMDE